MPVMVYPDRAECHILKNEELSRKYIEQVWAEAMEMYRSGEFRLMLSRESAEYLKDYQKQFMPEDADAGMILAFLISRGTGFVPKCFGKKLFTGIMSQRELN